MLMVERPDEVRVAIRAAIVNHRTDASDIEALVASVVAAGRRRFPA